MKRNLTELVFIIDRSGSMYGLEGDTIGGFNSMIKKQKAEDGECIVTTVLFDDGYELLHDRIPLSRIKPMSEKEYYVRGSTALLDAAGSSISRISNVQKSLPEEVKPEKVVFCIITDGYENSSCEYRLSDIRKMIEKKQEEGWEFIFMGANMDAVAEGAKYGISADRTVSYCCDKEGIIKTYKAMSTAVSMMRRTGRKGSIDSSWKKEVEADYIKRGRR